MNTQNQNTSHLKDKISSIQNKATFRIYVLKKPKSLLSIYLNFVYCHALLALKESGMKKDQLVWSYF